MSGLLKKETSFVHLFALDKGQLLRRFEIKLGAFDLWNGPWAQRALVGHSGGGVLNLPMNYWGWEQICALGRWDVATGSPVGDGEVAWRKTKIEDECTFVLAFAAEGQHFLNTESSHVLDFQGQRGEIWHHRLAIRPADDPTRVLATIPTSRSAGLPPNFIVALFERATRMDTDAGRTLFELPSVTLRLESDRNSTSATAIDPEFSLVSPRAPLEGQAPLVVSGHAKWVAALMPTKRVARVWETTTGLPITDPLWHEQPIIRDGLLE